MWLQFEYNVTLSYRKIKNKYYEADVSTIDGDSGV